MTVAELIEILKTKKQDAPVLVGVFSAFYDFEEAHADEVVEKFADPSSDKISVLIY